MSVFHLKKDVTTMTEMNIQNNMMEPKIQNIQNVYNHLINRTREKKKYLLQHFDHYSVGENNLKTEIIKANILDRHFV